MFTLQQGMITPAPTPIDVDEPTERVVAITPSVKPSATAIRTPELVAARDAPPVPTAKSTERPTDTPTAQTPVSATTDIPTPTATPATTSTPIGTHTPIATHTPPAPIFTPTPTVTLTPTVVSVSTPTPEPTATSTAILTATVALHGRSRESHSWKHRLSTWYMHGGTRDYQPAAKPQSALNDNVKIELNTTMS